MKRRPLLTMIAWEAAKRAYRRAPKGRRLAAWRRLQKIVHDGLKERRMEKPSIYREIIGPERAKERLKESTLACDRAMVTHSTEAEGFTARQIADAAAADMRRKSRNATLVAERKRIKSEKGGKAHLELGTAEPYAFAPRHVNQCTGAAHLIQLAIDDPAEGERTGVPATMRLYRSHAGLHGALAIVNEPAEPAPAADGAPPL